MERFKGMLFLLCAFSLGGTSVIAVRFFQDRLGTFTTTAVSLLFTLLCLLPLCGKKLRQTIRTLTLQEWGLLILQAVFGVLLFRMFLFFGISRTSAAEAGIVTGAMPAVTVLLARILLKETIRQRKLMGIFSTIAGILLIQGEFAAGAGFSTDHLAGNLLVLCAAASESLFNVLSRSGAVASRSSQQEQIHPVVQTTLISALGLFLCLLPALFEQPLASLSQIGWKEWLALVWYGPFVTALAYIFWYAGIKRCEASTAAALSGMMPFTALLLSVWIVGEHAGWQQWSGGMLVIFGMMLIGWEQRPGRKAAARKEARDMIGKEGIER